MKRWVLFVCMMAVVCFGFPAQGQSAGMMEDAKQVADQWLPMVDGGKYAESWNNASDVFKGKISQEKWESTARSTLEPLGPVVSRDLRAIVFTYSIPNHPDGEYMVIRLNTQFKNKADAVETVTLIREKGKVWKISGYFVN